MKVLIKRKHRPEFLRADGHWTSNVEEALDFPAGGAAVEQITKNNLSDTELLYRFQNSARDFCIPLHLRDL